MRLRREPRMTPLLFAMALFAATIAIVIHN
jgi:hypothetical protein